jgi:hypothetical protein
MTDARINGGFEPFHPNMTVADPSEEETARELDHTMGQIREKTFADSGHAIRSVHAKSHALLEAELEILNGLPPVLAQGLFAKPGTHPVIMRFSTIPGDILADSVSTPRGVAIKILDVEGERLEGATEQRTQDFIMVNGPSFSAANGEQFLKNLKLLAATTDRAEGLKKVLSATLRGLETALEAVGGESATLKTMGGQPQTHILGDTFFTQLPLRYGKNIAKLSIAPISAELKALNDKPLDDTSDPDAIRHETVDFFREHGGEWELRVQLCTNLEDMPIEPANKVWDEAQSPYLPVARIRARPQPAWSEARSTAVDDAMGFNPWNGIVEHWPLGSLMRMRQRAYKHSQEFRSERNRCPVHEPSSAQLPG